SVLANLVDGTIHSALVRRDVAQNASLRSNNFGDGYPVSLMGATALFRQTLYDARWHTDAHAAYDQNPAQARPEHSTALAALEAVARGDERIVLEANSTEDLLRLGRLVAEFELDAIAVGNGNEYQWLDEVAATGLTLVLPVNLPKAPKVGDEDDLSVTLDTLRHWDQAPENPQRLAEAGVDFVLTSHGLLDPKKLHANLEQAIDRGFDRDAALAALTTGPAELFGVADRLGTLERGKIANLVVTEGDLFVDKPKLRSVWVDGVRYELKEVKPPTVDPEGTWSLVIDAGPGGQIPVKVVLTGSVEDLDGSILGPGGSLPLAEAYVSAETVNFAFDSTPMGMPGMITFAMTIDGESASGSGTSPQGNFTFTGERTERPDPEGSR
ncbi:MAG: amidohydrolase family protein, partial [Acidobacteriota bacterium]